jgi:hypothetical protein
MRISRVLFLISLFAFPLAAQWQRFSIGVTGGVYLGRDRTYVSAPPGVYSTVDPQRFTGGLSFEAYLNDHVSLDFNPLFQKSNSDQSSLALIGLQSLQTRRTAENYSINMPVIGKYTFGERGKSWRPFAGAGFAFQTAWQVNRTQSILSNASGVEIQRSSNSFDSWAKYDVGAVFSSGIRFGKGRIQYVPELRYTRWGGANATHGRNQPEFLFSLRF